MRIEAINLRPLKSGGRGDLFLAQLRDNGTIVVVKFLRESHLPHERQAFLREINILAMGLVGMIRLIAYNKDADRPFYIMEYLSGGSLTRYAGRLAEQHLLTVATGLAQTLANFHARAGGHGDIKPDNILVSHDGQLKLGDPLGNGPVGLDGGFSVLFAPDRGGTEGYWAPEVKKGDKVSPSADVFSYAATLYHIATGRRPMDGQQLDPTVHGFGCPEWLRQLIVLCSQSDAKIRPTMNEVLRALRGESWQTIYEEKQRERLLSGLIICGLAVLGGAFLLQRSN
jgi:serine/threonine protein kinase